MQQVLDQTKLAKFFSEAIVGKPLEMAVAFWGEDAVKRLGLDQAQGGKIICNLESGCTNPDEILKLLPHFEVRTHSKLHAKLYKTADVAIVGSSNASLNGLALEGELKGWREINIATDDQKTLEALDDQFARLWKDALPVDETVVEQWRAMWKLRQSLARQPQSGSLIEAAIKDPGYFSDLDIYLVMSSEFLTQAQIKKLEKEVEKSDIAIYAPKNAYWIYNNIKTFELNSWFIDVEIKADKKGNVRANLSGVARTIDTPLKLKNKDKTQILLQRKDIVIGNSAFRISKNDKLTLEKCAAKLWGNGRGAGSVRIVKFADAIALFTDN